MRRMTTTTTTTTTSLYSNNNGSSSSSLCCSLWLRTLYCVLAFVVVVEGICPKDCNGQGVCTTTTGDDGIESVDRCVCEEGFMGPDCSLEYEMCPDGQLVCYYGSRCVGIKHKNSDEPKTFVCDCSDAFRQSIFDGITCQPDYSIQYCEHLPGEQPQQEEEEEDETLSDDDTDEDEDDNEDDDDDVGVTPRPSSSATTEKTTLAPTPATTDSTSDTPTAEEAAAEPPRSRRTTTTTAAEQKKRALQYVLTTSSNSLSFCVNGGSCIDVIDEEDPTTFHGACECPHGYTGDYCEYLKGHEPKVEGFELPMWAIIAGISAAGALVACILFACICRCRRNNNSRNKAAAFELAQLNEDSDAGVSYRDEATSDDGNDANENAAISEQSPEPKKKKATPINPDDLEVI